MKLKFDEETHSYYLDGKWCWSATGVAEIPLDKKKLNQWSERMVAIGLATDPDLVQNVAAHVDDKEILNGYCEDAKKLAKSDRGSRRGTAVHRITDRIDTGEEIIPTELALGVQASWQKLWEASGLEVIPEFVERVIVYPHERICGKLDRIGRTAKGHLVIVDTKTGKWELSFPKKAAAQLGIYANAPLLAGPLNEYGETAEFEPMPNVSKKWGVLIHMPETGVHQSVKLDIEKGWEAAKSICFPSVTWRNYPDRLLVQPLAKLPAPPAWQPPDEGEPLSEIEINGLRKAFKDCPDRIVVDTWIKQSVEAGQSFNVAGPGCSPTMRRRRIIEAAIVWSAHEDDVVRSALSLAIGQEIQPGTTTGAAFGSLSTDEAVRLEFFGESLNDGGMFLTFAEDGTPILSDPSPVPAA